MFRLQPRIIAALFLLVASAQAGLVDRVDPFIGTANGGNTFPGALVPWGMVSVSPHNDPGAPSGYRFGKTDIYGFGQVHLSGTGCPDLGSVILMPTRGKVQVSSEQWKSPYDLEKANPGYYSVHLKANDIQAEMTATTRVGLSRYFFPESKGDANILLDVSGRLTTDPVTQTSPVFESWVKILSSAEVEGFSESGDFCSPYAGNKQTVFFVVQFSKPAVEMGTWKDGNSTDQMEQKGKSVGAFFRFSTAAQEPVVTKVGVSYVSIENARLNLPSECPGWDFEGVKTAARSAWEEVLSRIRIFGGTEDQLKIFYTALYHALI